LEEKDATPDRTRFFQQRSVVARTWTVPFGPDFFKLSNSPRFCPKSHLGRSSPPAAGENSSKNLLKFRPIDKAALSLLPSWPHSRSLMGCLFADTGWDADLRLDKFTRFT